MSESLWTAGTAKSRVGFLSSLDARNDAEVAMRTTVNLDDELLARAAEMTGIRERSALLREALEALVARESSRRLARLGGTDPRAGAGTRRRTAAPKTAGGRSA